MAHDAAPLLLLVALYVLVASHFSPSFVSGAAEVETLLKFKASLGNNKALQSWVAGTDPCSQPNWAGVLCDKLKFRGLQLENMGLTGLVDVDTLANLSGLRTLSLANNSFRGPIPDISKLGSLKSIYLSDNKFSGMIPADVFARMGSLKKVHLSNNEFSGPIPRSLARVAKLLEVKLERNWFDGKIPDFQQQALTAVNMSHNQLEGSIPANLRRFDASSFAGNKDLCGKPLANSCKSSKKISTALLILIIVLPVVVIAMAAICAILTLLGLRRQKPSTPRVADNEKLALNKQDVLANEPLQQIVGDYKNKSEREIQELDERKLVFVNKERGVFELYDLMRASAEVLGNGRIGWSYKAVLLNGQAMAVKRFTEMNGMGKEEFEEQMKRIGELRHPYLLPLLAFYCRKEETLLVSDYIPGGSLAQILHAPRTPDRHILDWPSRLRIVKGITRGLIYLFKELPNTDLPHGHLKSSNVLLSDNFEPLLGDYGLTPAINKEAAKTLMAAYQSPEFLKSGRVTRKTDVWSLGILILEILTGKAPAKAAELVGWVNSVVREEWTGEVFDREMTKGNPRKGEGEMLKLLKIGLECCESNVEKRLEVGDAFERIEELREWEDEDSSFATDGDVYSSRAMTEQDDFSFSISTNY